MRDANANGRRQRARGVALLAALVLLGGGLGVRFRPADASGASKNGRIVFASWRYTGRGVDNNHPDYEIFSMKPDGSGLRQLTHNDVDDSNPAWSPDGRQIAFVHGRDPYGSTGDPGEIYVMQADGSQPTNLTQNPADDFDPAWSPDGTKIAFVSDRDGPDGLYVMDADGGHPTRLTQNADAADPAWSPNGAQIAFDADCKLFLMQADGTQVHEVTTPFSCSQHPAWSPDGKRIAFDGDERIIVMKTDGTDLKKLSDPTGFSEQPVWSPDGTTLAFVGYHFIDDFGGFGDIYTVRINGSHAVDRTVVHDQIDPDDVDPSWQPKPR